MVPDPSRENLERLDALLQELGGRVDVGDRLLDSTAISTFLKTGDRTLVLDGPVVRVRSLEHLLAMKRSSDRPRDHDDLEALEAAQEGKEGER